MNPARSFGPAAITKFDPHHWVRTITLWEILRCSFNSIKILCDRYLKKLYFVLKVYWFGPMFGGMCAGMVYQMLFRMKRPESYEVGNPKTKIGLLC